MSEKTMIFCDAANSLLPHMTKDLPMTVVPCQIHIGSKSCYEYLDLNPIDFYRILNESGDDYPSSSMPTPEQFSKAYKKAADDGYTHAIVTCVSAASSGALNSARLGRELMRADGDERMRIELVDSVGFSMTYGFPLLRAAKMAKENAPFEDILATFRKDLARQEALFACYTLKFLKKSGRISGMSAFAGETLGIKPILSVFRGVIKPIDKVRGEKNLVPRLMALLEERVVAPEKQVLHLHYGDVPMSLVDAVEGELRKRFKPLDVDRTIIGCSVAINCGPPTVAVLYEGAQGDDAPLVD